MKTIEKVLMTPRATIRVHTQFDTIQEARENGWGFWFQFNNYMILGKDNRAGAVVEGICNGICDE